MNITILDRQKDEIRQRNSDVVYRHHYECCIEGSDKYFTLMIIHKEQTEPIALGSAEIHFVNIESLGLLFLLKKDDLIAFCYFVSSADSEINQQFEALANGQPTEENAILI